MWRLHLSIENFYGLKSCKFVIFGLQKAGKATVLPVLSSWERFWGPALLLRFFQAIKSPETTKNKFQCLFLVHDSRYCQGLHCVIVSTCHKKHFSKKNNFLFLYFLSLFSLNALLMLINNGSVVCSALSSSCSLLGLFVPLSRCSSVCEFYLPIRKSFYR